MQPTDQVDVKPPLDFPRYPERDKPAHTFALFPYLKTSGPVRYRGVTFASTEDVSSLSPAATSHLDILRKRFFLQDSQRIVQFIYAYSDAPVDGSRSEEFLEKVREFRILLTYTYAAPVGTEGTPFLRHEHGTVFILRPRALARYLFQNQHNIELVDWPALEPSQDAEEVFGYEGLVDNRDHVWLSTVSRVYPPAASIWLNISQDLFRDIEVWSAQPSPRAVLTQYLGRTRISLFDERVLTALEWYNRSCSGGLDDEVLLINLAVAFESLLGLEAGEKVTARFNQAIEVLLGPIPRLRSWSTQFYDARSQIVHEGRTRRLMFVPIDDPSKTKGSGEDLRYRDLIVYGRTVFRICAATILTGSRLAEELRVADLFRTNRERLQEICRAIGEAGEDPAGAILSVEEPIRMLEQHRFVSEGGLTIDLLLGTAKIVLNAYRETQPSEDPDTLRLLDQLVKIKASEHLVILDLINQFQSRLKQETDAEPRSLPVRRLVRSVVDTVWHYTFMYYFALRDRRRAETAGHDSTPAPTA